VLHFVIFRLPLHYLPFPEQQLLTTPFVIFTVVLQFIFTILIMFKLLTVYRDLLCMLYKTLLFD